MKKEYSKNEIERILKSEVEIPEAVNRGINRAYSEIGMESEQTTMKYTKKHRAWVAVAIAATMVMGMSVVVVAATKFLNANLVEHKDHTVGYQVEVDRTKEAHEIKVETTYIPEGYVPMDPEDPQGGKWTNEATGGDISVYYYNAAEVDRFERLGQGVFRDYSKDAHLKDMEVGGAKADIFVSDQFYTDSDKTVKSLYLFNEEQGYAVCVWSESSLSSEEVIKIAQGLKVTVLDTVVPYATDEEIAAAKNANETEQKGEEEVSVAGVSKDAIFEIGEEVEAPVESIKKYEDVRYTVEDVQVKDALSLDEYPAEYYVDYENEIVPWVNPDGTLKPHDRYWYQNMDKRVDNGTLQTNIGSKYVVVKMKAVNYMDAPAGADVDMGVFLAPELTTLEPREDGNYSYPSSFFFQANENYKLQWEGGYGSNFPVYFDKMYYTEGIRRMKDALFRPLDAGDELEYTLIYIMDEDRLDQMYLKFYAGVGSADEVVNTPYVKISK